MQCPGCGAENDASAESCVACGVALGSADKATQVSVGDDKPAQSETTGATDSAAPPVMPASPVLAEQPDAPAPTQPAASSKAKRTRMLLIAGGIVAGLVVAGLLWSGLSSTADARTKAQGAIRAASANVDEASLAAATGTDEESQVADAKRSVAAARASFARGWFLSSGPYLDAAKSAAAADSIAAKIVELRQAEKRVADDARDRGAQREALDAYLALYRKAPASDAAKEGMVSAEEMLATTPTNGPWVGDLDRLGMMADLLAAQPQDAKSESVIAAAKDVLLAFASSELSNYKSVASTNKQWYQAMKRSHRVKGALANRFIYQDVDSTDVAYDRQIAAALAGLGQPGTMKTLVSTLIASARTCASCKNIAVRPVRKSTVGNMTTRFVTPAQINRIGSLVKSLEKSNMKAAKLIASLRG